MHMRSGRMRLSARYSGVLTLGADAEGLYLGVIFLFRVGHPRLFIPWSDVRAEPVKKRLFWTRQTLRIGRSDIPLELGLDTAKQLLRMKG